jgi:hypothetical protein
MGGFKAFELTFYDDSVVGTCARLVVEHAEGRFQLDARNGGWLKSAEGSKPLTKLFPFATHTAEFDDAPLWDKRDVFASYGWISPSTLEFSVRELDATRRTFVRISVDGLYAVYEIWAEGMLGGLEPMKYVVASKLTDDVCA